MAILKLLNQVDAAKEKRKKTGVLPQEEAPAVTEKPIKTTTEPELKFEQYTGPSITQKEEPFWRKAVKAVLPQKVEEFFGLDEPMPEMTPTELMLEKEDSRQVYLRKQKFEELYKQEVKETPKIPEGYKEPTGFFGQLWEGIKLGYEQNLKAGFGYLAESMGRQMGSREMMLWGQNFGDKTTIGIMKRPELQAPENLKPFAEGGAKDPRWYGRMIGTTVPYIGSTIALATVGGLVGGPAGAAVGGYSSVFALEKGNAYKRMIDNGVAPDKADTASNVYGAISALIENAFGISPSKIGTQIVSKGAERVAYNSYKSYLIKELPKLATKTLKTALEEGGEEVAQSLTENLVNNWVGNEGPVFSKQMIEEFAGGFVASIPFGVSNVQIPNIQKAPVIETTAKPAITPVAEVKTEEVVTPQPETEVVSTEVAPTEVVQPVTTAPKPKATIEKVTNILNNIEERVKAVPVEEKVTTPKAATITTLPEVNKENVFSSLEEATTKPTTEGAKSIYLTPYNQTDFVISKIMNGEQIPAELNYIAVELYNQGVLEQVETGEGTKVDLTGMFFETEETVDQPKTYAMKFVQPDEGGFDKTSYEEIYGKSLDEAGQMDWQTLQQGSGIDTKIQKGDIVSSSEIVDYKTPTKGKNKGVPVQTSGYGVVQDIYDNGDVVVATKDGFQTVNFYNTKEVDEKELKPEEKAILQEIRTPSVEVKPKRTIRGKTQYTEIVRNSPENDKTYPKFEPAEFSEENLFVNAGDYIINRDGEAEVVTSGNMKWKNNTTPLASFNVGSLRARYLGDTADVDFMDYANQIRKATPAEVAAIKKYETTKATKTKPEGKEITEEVSAEYGKMEKEFYDYAVENEDKLIADYEKEFGNYLGGDNVKELFPQYMENPAANYMASRKASNYLWNKIFQKWIADKKGVGDNEVLVLMGGPGSGKTASAVNVLGKDYKDKYSFVVEVTGHDKTLLERTVNKIIDEGFGLVTTHIYADMDHSFERTLARAMSNGGKNDGKGRTVYIPEFVKRHLGAIELSKEYLKDHAEGDWQHLVALNTGPKGQAKILSTDEALEVLGKSQYNKSDEDNLINKYYGQAIQIYKEGGISKDVYEGTTGISGDATQKAFGESRIAGQSAEQGGVGRRGNEVEEIKLPRELTGAKPRYGFGDKLFTLNFQSDIDKALYIVAKEIPSKADAKYVEFLQEIYPDNSVDELRMKGSVVRSAIKELARDSKPGNLVIGKVEQPTEKGVSTQREKVAEAIKEEPKAIREIAEETQILEPNIRRILGVGTKEGVFERVDKGVYILRKEGKDIAYIHTGNAVEILPKLASEGFKADMVFLDIPYKTPAVVGGNRGIKYAYITPEQFKIVVKAVKDIVRSEDSAVFYMYSQARSGLAEMKRYNDAMTDAGFIPLAKGGYTKYQKDGITRVRNMRGDIIEPEGLIMFNLSGNNISEAPVKLDFHFVRPKGWQTEKPAGMLAQLIKLSTQEGEVVLDPFAGSGVTLAEAVRAGRKAVGIEVSEKAIEEHIKPRVKEAAKEIAKERTKVVGRTVRTEKLPAPHLFAQKLMVKNPALPILSNFIVKGGELSATDLEIAVKLNTDLKNGIYKIVGKEAVLDTSNTIEDFPLLPEVKGDLIAKSLGETIETNLKRANLSKAKDFRRPELNGVLFEVNGNKATIVSTDSFRLFRKTSLLKGNADAKFIIPSDKLAKVFSAIGPLAEIYNEESAVHFTGKFGSISVRKIQGEYPNYAEVYPAFNKQYEITRKDFLAALKEVKPFTNYTNQVEITYKDGKFTLTAQDKERNLPKKTATVSATERTIPEVNAQSPNDGVIVMQIMTDKKDTLSYNVQFLIDTLNSLEETSVFMYPSSNINSPTLFSDERELNSEPKKKQIAPSGMASTSGGKMGEFENVGEEAPASEQMKIYEEVKKLIQKYAKTIGEGYTPRNALGVFYPDTTNIRVTGLNDLSLASHEIAHFLDQSGLITKQVMEVVGTAVNGNPLYAKDTLPIRRELTDLYEKYYPGAKRTHKLEKRMVEGFATLLQKFTEQPTTIADTYPNVVREFLMPDGKFYKPVMGDIVKDLLSIVANYQGLKPLDKIGARVVNDKVNVNKDSFLNFADKFKTEVADNIYPIEKLAKLAGVHFTALDPSLWVRQYNNSNALILNNINGGRGYWGWRNGELVKIYDYNWKSLVDSLHKAKLTDQFAYYLVARREHFLFEDYNKMDAKDPNRVQLGRTLENDGFTEKEVFDAYIQNKDTFKQFEDMYDNLVAEDLKFLYDPEVQLLDSEAYDKLASKEGYASFQRYFYDEVAGEAEKTVMPKKFGTTKVSSLIKRSGSQKPIMNPLFSALKNHAEITRKGLKQIVYNHIGQIAPKFPELFQISQLKVVPDISGRLLFPQEKDPNIIMARIGYKRRPVLTDAVIKRTVDEVLNTQNITFFEKLLMGSSRFFTKGTTGLFPGFALTNYTVDQVTALAQTRNKYLPLYDPLKKISVILDMKNPQHKYFQEYMIMGGERQTFVGWQDMSPNELFDAISKERQGLLKAIDYINKGMDILAIPSKYSEIMTRATEYIKSRQSGKPAIAALEEAGRVTAPFHHIGRLGGGRVGQTFIKSIPFFNPGIQVLAQAAETVGTPEGRKRYLFTTLAVTAASIASMGLLMATGTDEQKKLYADIHPDELNKYIWLPNPNGKTLIKVRVPDQMAVFSTLANMMIADKELSANYTAGEYFNAGVSWLPQQLDISQPARMFMGWIPQLIKPGVLTLVGMKDFPKIMPMESQLMTSRSPEYRYNESTSPVAKRLGKVLGMSPIKIDYLLTGYFGRATGFLTGKPGIYNPLKSMSREYYFTSGRKIQSYYDRKALNDQDYYDIKHGLRTVTKKEAEDILAEREKLKVINNLISAYKDLDEVKHPKTMQKYRDQILIEIDKL
ncbi:MAG: DNA methyltransferase [Phycisphaerae bacterium]|nr:DNA methyltransferase [Phycisphaerae bacterium]